MTIKVLISDKMNPAAAEIFQRNGIQADVKTGLSEAELIEIISDYDGLAVRSSTKVTPAVLDAAKNLKVIGRAGIGVDTIDVPACTQKGIVVMNTPFGNSTTTAEHALAMMFSIARQIPQANATTHQGKWEKSKFMGVELTGKILGIVGCGNIGSIVANRAIGLKMKVLAFDPFLSHERAEEIGVEKLELDDLLKRADFITLHTPLTDKTRNIISTEKLKITKKGVYIINCARGGLIDEVALKDALDSGHVAGAALDVFAKEPATEHPLFGNEKVVCTPHLGASTVEAQEIVALQIADQMSDFLVHGAVANAINMASVTAEEAPVLKPYIALSELLGSFAGQSIDFAIKNLEIIYEGNVAKLNTKPLTAAIIAGLLRPMAGDINMVNGTVVLKEKGIKLSEVRRDQSGIFDGYIMVNVTTEKQTLSVAGTVFSDKKPRLIKINKVPMEAEFAPYMLFTRNSDKPGYIGALGTVLGGANLNIANFNLGRAEVGGDAIALVHLDEDMPANILEQVKKLGQVLSAIALKFDI